jgi:hypothetical protein
VRRVWLRAALSSGVAMHRFTHQEALYRLHIEYPHYLYPPPSTTLQVVIWATFILALASLTLPPLALGAGLRRALLTSVLNSISRVLAAIFGRG